jgi:multiple sugar transport system substrate-binding protein
MKHRTQALVAIALSAAMVVSLAACGDDDDDDGAEGTTAEGTTAEGTTADGTDSGDGGEGGGASLTMLIASSGDAETNAVRAATDAWAAESGNSVEVVVATDMVQELAQGFASGNPPDIFYLDASRFGDNAEAGNLYAYEAENNDDFYESLRQTFTFDGTQYCAPKDFSTLALQINTAAWEAAGLTDADIPTDYDQLAAVAEQLTTGDQVGLVLSSGIDRAGAFVVGNGGWWLNEDATEPTANTPEVLAGLQYVQDNIAAGNFALAAEVDAGWGGEAFGTQKAAMTLEGNWIRGAMTNDYPDVAYTVAAMPEGPAGPGTLLFTQCWGIAADSDNQDQAVDLVNFLTSPEQQLAAAEAFGVMPSRQAAAADYEAAFPENAAFIAGGEYGHGPISAPNMEAVVADLNSQLETIGTADLEGVVESFDTNASAELGG